MRLTIILLFLIGFSVFPGGAKELNYRNRISFIPFSGMTANGYFNPALGVDYEYRLPDSFAVGFCVLIAGAYPMPGQSRIITSGMYVAPGFLFHTDCLLFAPGKKRWFDFATGASISLGNLRVKEQLDPYTKNNPGSYHITDISNHSLGGILFNNCINLSGNHFQFGFDARFGLTFEEYNQDRLLTHIGMHFGVRF